MSPLITSRTDWSMPLLKEVYRHIEEIALNDLQLDVYDNQVEIISAEQMLDAYASIGMPVHYNHWSFGKRFLRDWTRYQRGHLALAYEIVINSDPCISYLMEENSAVTQALVIAHAAFGHNFVFKHNYMFKEWTSPHFIIDYLIFAKNYIRQCEERYGEDEVERVLDCAHSLASHGIDKHKRRHKKRLSEEELLRRQAAEADEEQRYLDVIVRGPARRPPAEGQEKDLDHVGDEENLIYFIYKNAPHLEPWKREVMRIVYKIQQYFYPQRQDKVLNEGFATFVHYYIMNELERRGIISADAQLAWLHQHSSVIYQPPYNSRHFDGSFNPYALGFAILNEVRRVCEAPTREDEEWFPRLAGTDWRQAVRQAVTDYRDESFIEQFMTPKLIRDWRLFTVDVAGQRGVVTEISDDLGYRAIRQQLARAYNPINYVPEIVVRSAKLRGDRTLTLEYRPFEGRQLLARYAAKVLENIKYLWGFDVRLVQVDGGRERVLFSTR